eukprot:9473613-Pyramimonas_sp.AAC.1
MRQPEQGRQAENIIIYIHMYRSRRKDYTQKHIAACAVRGARERKKASDRVCIHIEKAEETERYRDRQKVGTRKEAKGGGERRMIDVKRKGGE